MIRVKVYRRDEDHKISSFVVEGHAEFAQSGKDIVCAGVSTVTVGTVNAIEALLGVTLQTSMNLGLLSVSIPDEFEHELSAKLQLLLESMLVMLRSIEDSYGAYITIKEQFK